MIKHWNKTTQFLNKHSLISLYTLMFLGLLFGIYLHSKFEYLNLLLIFASSLYFSYWLIFKIKHKIYTQNHIIPSINLSEDHLNKLVGSRDSVYDKYH